MQEIIVIAVVTVLAVCATEVLSPRVRIASPLLLVLLGLGISLLPVTPEVEVDPELILEVILPPLLYASALAMPAISFRRDSRPITLLAITLVLATALGIGLVFWWLVPELGFGWAVALGALLAPTDAVAVSVLRGGRVPPRVLTILSGESLLNDASSLVILRTAIAAAAGGFSLLSAVGSFAWALATAVLIGWLVAMATLWLGARIESATVNTLLSFTLPFLASVPTEAVGGSGLVAAVVTGLIVGARGPRVLPADHRLSGEQNWASAQLVLEGVVFLLMGLQLSGVLADVETDSIGVLPGLGYAALAIVLFLAIRAVFVKVSLKRMRRRTARGESMMERIEQLERLLDEGVELRRPEFGQRPGHPRRTPDERPRPPRRPVDRERFAARLRRVSADIGYYSRQPLGRAEGAVMVWGGMRGAVTVAAAQTLPLDAPHRSLLVFVAFAVATASLLLQGGTIGALAGRLYRADDDTAAAEAAAETAEQRERLRDLMAGAVGHAPTPAEKEAERPWRAEEVLAGIRRKREVLLDARDDGLFDAELLDETLAELDVTEVALQMRSTHRDG